MSGIPAGAGSLLGKRLGKYEILALLALGGTAEIYLARIGGAAGFEKYVVVKCLHDHLADDQEFVKMFLDEARLAAHLDHSNIVQTMELGEHENRYYMVMEFLAGLSLAMIVRRAGERLPGGRMPAALTLNIMAQACAGLHYAHERSNNGKHLQIVHRDISPQNLVVSFEGVVKVVDFGIAKAEQRETKTRSGTIKGKFAYMSPEQCVANNVDRRTDVFALGVIAHELLTGRRLFKKNSPYETYQAVIECAVEPPSKLNHELDPAIDAIVMKAVAKDKDDRYPTAEAFGDALQGYLHHRGKGSGPGELGRFFDTTFAQEIEEHGARMRELISGQDEFSVDTGVKWDEEEEARAAAAAAAKGADQTRDIRRQNEDSISLSAVDLVSMDRPVERPSEAGLSEVIGSFGDTQDREADDAAGESGDMPVDRTRIEANPLELLAEMNAAKVEPPKPAAPPTIAMRASPSTPPASTPLPSVRSASQPLPSVRASTQAPAQTGPQQQVRSTGPQPVAPQPPPQHQQHKMPPSGPLPLPSPPTGPHAPVAAPNMATQMVQVDPPAPAGRAATGFPNFSNLPTMVAELETPESAAGSTQIDRQAYVDPPPPPQPPPMSQAPTGYPVMNQQLSNAMISGDVFPSSGAYQPQQLPDSGQLVSMASPVGPAYGQHVDWAQAAATPAKAMPRWQLVAMFVAAILGALLITVIIAKIAG